MASSGRVKLSERVLPGIGANIEGKFVTTISFYEVASHMQASVVRPTENIHVGEIGNLARVPTPTQVAIPSRLAILSRRQSNG